MTKRTTDPAVNDQDAGTVMLERARSLAPLFRAHAEANESARELAPEVMAALDEGGFFGLFTPRCVGGSELAPLDAIRVVEEVAYADGPTAWVLFATGLCIGAAGAYLGDGAVQQLFAGKIPVMAGQGIPNGKAEVVNGGYRLSGNWSYGSGVKHSEYIHTGAIVFENGAPRRDAAGAPEVRIFYVPREVVVFGDNWNVLGLKATGSIDYAIPEVFVGEDYTYFARTTTPRRGGNSYQMGTIGIGAAGHTAFALGAGRRMLDELAVFAQTKVGRPGMLGESESFLEGFADAEAKYRGARAFVYETWTAVQAALDNGETLSTRQITLVRLALNHATWTAAAVCDFAYKAAGGAALRDGVIQRYYRDMHAGTQHITSSPGLLRECGRDLAGVAVGKVWNFLGLVDTAAT